MNIKDRIQKLLVKVYVPIAWTLVIIILLCIPGTMLPSEEGFSVPNFDKLIHWVLFGLFVFLWCFYFRSKKYRFKKLMIIFFLVFLLSNILGVTMEFVQRCCVPFRDFSEGDIIADMIGSGLGYGISNIFLTGEKNANH